MGTRKRIIHKNYECFHYKGLEGPHACFATKLTYYTGVMAQASSQVKRREDDFTLKEGRQGGAGGYTRRV
jgi:hypothetical protein